MQWCLVIPVIRLLMTHMVSDQLCVHAICAVNWCSLIMGLASFYIYSFQVCSCIICEISKLAIMELLVSEQHVYQYQWTNIHDDLSPSLAVLTLMIRRVWCIIIDTAQLVLFAETNTIIFFVSGFSSIVQLSAVECLSENCSHR